MITEKIQTAVSQALKELYNIDINANEVVLQKTKKEFQGDFTVVVFPFVKQAHKAPDAVANELGSNVCGKVQELDGFNVIK